MENKVLEAAIAYREKGFSIIPVKENKKPCIKWERYQTEKPDRGLIKEWFDKWPNANVAIVTGKVSGVDVIDIDSQEGEDKIH
jgi:hypothetical protein